MTRPSVPDIAVLIPAYNEARRLPRCLAALLDQPVPPDEIVVVDDGSTDDSVAVVERALGGVAGARIVRNGVNRGILAALDAGMREIRSEYVLFLAANDLVLPGLFARAKRLLAQHPGVGVWSAMAWLIDDDDRPLRLHASPVVSLRERAFSPEECIAMAQRVGNWFTGTTLVYHLDKLRAVGAFQPEYRAATDVMAALSVASLHGAAYTPEPLAAFRIHEGSYSSRTLNDPRALDEFFEALQSKGPRVSPGLFTDHYLGVNRARYRFASIRSSRGASLGAIAAAAGGRRGSLLRLIDRVIPGRWGRLRVLLAYPVLVPFDLWPALRYRLLPWLVVRLRSRLPESISRRA